MTPSPFAQADLFGDDDEVHAPSLRGVRARASPPKRQRAASAPDPESAARVLDAHDDYRVLRRLQPRPSMPHTGQGPTSSSPASSTSRPPASTTAGTR